MCVTIVIVWESYDLEYTADKMARPLGLGLILAQCPVWKEIVVSEERRWMMMGDNLDTFEREMRA